MLSLMVEWLWVVYDSSEPLPGQADQELADNCCWYDVRPADSGQCDGNNWNLTSAWVLLAPAMSLLVKEPLATAVRGGCVPESVAI